MVFAHKKKHQKFFTETLFNQCVTFKFDGTQRWHNVRGKSFCVQKRLPRNHFYEFL